MIYKIGDSIISPFGSSTEDNYVAVLSGLSSIELHPTGTRGVPFPFAASLMNPLQLEDFASAFMGAGTHLVSRMRQAMAAALGEAMLASIVPSFKEQIFRQKRVLVIVCTTKGNVESLDNNKEGTFVSPRAYSWHIAQHHMESLHMTNKPVVLTSTAISGLQAQLLALRLLDTFDRYDYAVVIGVELVQKLALQGFQSLGVLSDKRCKPYDENRKGMNLGEAAACVIYASSKAYERDKAFFQQKRNTIALVAGKCTCDAYAIDHPSPSGEGLYMALSAVKKDIRTRDIAFINGNGAGLLAPDEAESVAIERAGLSKIPLNSYKANFGYSSGTAGLIESIVSCRAFEDNVLLPTLGYERKGVTGAINVASGKPTWLSKRKPYFIKSNSGYGGLNAALLFTKL